MRPTLPSTREVIPEAERPDFVFTLPGSDDEQLAPYVVWEQYHKALGQELAKRIRKEA